MAKEIPLTGKWIDAVQPGVPFTLAQKAEEVAKEPPERQKVIRKKYSVGARTLGLLGELLTKKEVAAICKVSERTVNDWIYHRKLKRVKSIRHIRIAAADLEEFLGA